MSRILNTDGEYDPEVPSPAAQPIVADPSELPKRKPDPYANVDHTDFSGAGSMSRVAMLTMASLAHDRGDHESSKRWRITAMQKAQLETNAENAERMAKIMEGNHPVPPPGSQIVPSIGTSPWESDAEWRALSETYRQAQAKASSTGNHEAGFADAAKAAEVARDAMNARRESLRETAMAQGVWSIQDEKRADAQSGIASKAGQLIDGIGGA